MFFVGTPTFDLTGFNSVYFHIPSEQAPFFKSLDSHLYGLGFK